ncbi:NADH:flavin oxidoreductase [Rhodococcus sp. ARC_M6]|uniref:NADH:flavin oxidoreductase n=1 Tax=Rhodococcus sp. ARC_M6 TaxID=2928852 RepID=UPI001FB4492C|nr:NADH:flavin oxidoreductase [Rhodococcus sp. ARC_M6]MCJ0902799.1 NADH:flavin oxidoreductase [Rhodococcus sp. ARC_M6]
MSGFGVFGAATLGPTKLRNRTIKAATFEGMTPDGSVTEELIAFHRAQALGGVAVTTVAGCAVSADGASTGGQIVMRPAVVPGLRRLTDVVHEAGAAASIQLNHAGPVADVRANGHPAVAPGKVFSFISLRNSKAASEVDIERITQDFVNGALHAVDAGFDVIEIHMGHNYFISSMLSPKLNKRTDGHGGSLSNRARMARDVAKRVREVVGDRAAVIAKLSMDDGVPGGTWIDEALQTAQWLDEDGALDALELTVGSSLLNPMYLFKGESPITEFAAVMPQPVKLGTQLFGKLVLKEYPYQDLFLLEQARQFIPAVKVPLILLGGITDRAGMDTAMGEGFSFVAIGRALLREPDLINQIKADNHKRSLCIHCNRCMPTTYTGTRCVLTS